MEYKMKVKKNFFYTLLSQVLAIILGLLIPRLTMVGYGSEVNGLLSSVTQFIAYLNIFEAGIQVVAQKSLYGPVARGERKRISEILAAVSVNYKRTGYCYLVGLIVIAIGFAWFSQSEIITFLMAFFITLFSGLGNVILFFVLSKYRILMQVEGKGYLLGNVQMILGVLTNIMKIVLLIFGFNVVLIVFSTFCISMFQVFSVIWFAKKHYPWLDLNAKPDYSTLSERSYALIHNVSGLIFSNTDVVILTIFCGLKVVSVYSLYKLITGQIKSFIVITWSSASFAFGQIFNTNKDIFIKRLDEADWIYNTLTMWLFSVTWFLLTPFISIYTRGINDIYYVDKFLPVLFVLTEVLYLSRAPMKSVIDYAGHFKLTVGRSIVESVINLTVSIALVLKIGIYGVLIGTVIAMLYRTVDIIVYSNTNILKRKPWKTIYSHAINLIIMFGIQLIFRKYAFEISSYADFAIAGIFCSIISFIIFVLVNVLTHVTNTKEIIKRYIKNKKSGSYKC